MRDIFTAELTALGDDLVALSRLVEAAIAGRGAEVRRRFSSLPALAVSADAAGVAALRSAPGVVSAGRRAAFIRGSGSGCGGATCCPWNSLGGSRPAWRLASPTCWPA